MKFFADLHIHSRYSRATSSRLVPELLDRWAKVKGLALIGTGDFTHPAWFSELKEKLVPAEEGLYVLSPEVRDRMLQDSELAEIPVPARAEGIDLPDQTRFILSAEISTIYSSGGRVRKVHHVILSPSFEAVSRIQDRLSRIGNLASDGRPILGLDSRDLLEILLEADPSCVLIPAHIWTPWFSVLGSKSGFDSIEEAYRDLAEHIFALETGLSSDPPMNWLCSKLDRYAIISNSDAHSPENLGREANKFDTDLSYPALVMALREAAGTVKPEMEQNAKGKWVKQGEQAEQVERMEPVGQVGNPEGQTAQSNRTKQTFPSIHTEHTGETPDSSRTKKTAVPRNKKDDVARGFLGTVEFFPQEGKYHFDGHRRCGVVMDPIETARHGGKCPVCGKALTVGVMNRLISLADRVELEERPRRRDFISLIPLKEVLSELLGVGAASRALEAKYRDLIRRGGPELWLLGEAPIEQIERIGGMALAEGIRRMRERRVHVEEGFDGEYGHVRVFSTGIAHSSESEASLFPDLPKGKAMGAPPEPRGLLDFDIRDLAALKRATRFKDAENARDPGKDLREGGAEGEEEGTGGEGSNAASIEPAIPATQRSPRAFHLNPEQQKAVEHAGGPLLILAGPGTGKTNTLTHRIAHLLKSGVPAENMIALTFTHNAAEEMRTRLGNILALEQERQKSGEKEERYTKENQFHRVKICTFHSFGLDILKEFHHRFGRSEHFVLLSEEDSARILNSVELGWDKTLKGVLVPKNRKSADTPELHARYKELLRELDAFDLEDLLDLPVKLLEEDSEVRTELRRRYTHLFVDEYQDVNEPQYRLLHLLAPDETAHLTVIGDPDQAIYGFRGANVGFIQRFTLDYPSATVISLSTSYRCPEVVLKASQQVLRAGNTGRDAKDSYPLSSFLSGLPSDLKIQISQHPSDAAEAEYISRTIENLTGGLRFFSMDSEVSDGHSEELDPGEIAVLCRTSRQMECLEKAFQDHAIPYLRVGERSFLQEEPVSSLLDLARYFTVPQNPYFKTVASRKIEELLHRNWISTAVSPEDLVRIREERVRKEGKEVPTRSLPAREVLETLIDTLGFAESIPRSFDVERLLTLAGDSSLSEFLQHAATRSSQDDLPYHASRVILSTIHGVKGLEFTCVFIAGCEDGLLPYTLFTERAGESTTETKSQTRNSGQSTGISIRSSDIEEERRLFYVGMTRSKRYLYLSWAARRFLFGREYRLGPSSFLQTIEEELLKRVDPEYRKRPSDRQLSLF